MKIKSTFFVMALILLFHTPLGCAKRLPPEPVEPVVYNDIEFRAPLHKMGTVQAWKEGALIWEKSLYQVDYEPGLERDVQDVYINDMRIDDNFLIVRNEKNKTFRIDIKSVPDLTGEKEDEAKGSVVSGNSRFTFDLYARLKAQKGNLFFSPYSISTALAMTYVGARGQTESQMRDTLCFFDPQSEFHEAFGRLEEQLNEQGKKGDYQLAVANALWAQKDFKFLDAFLDLARKAYSAKLENVDFKTNAEGARKRINGWVEEKTNDKIKNLIPSGVLDALTRLVLTNAIYFKGDWALQFDEAKTTQQDFYISPDETVKAPLMYQKEEFKYGQMDTMQMLQLPYKGEDLSMLVLLPKEKDGLADLEKELSVEKITQWQKKMHSREVLVYLPRFKMTYRCELGGILAAMGMPDAFGGGADFSGMTGSKDLLISHVIHKAFVAVDEEGTEAAAATAVVMKLTSAGPPPPTFRADHPFIFLIQDNKTGSILFMGRVADPTKEE